MLGNFSLQEIIGFIFIVLAVIFRMLMFKKVKKATGTKEGREYIAKKGAKIFISTDGCIFLSVIIFILISVFSLNIIWTVILESIILALIIFIFKRFKM